MNPKKFLQIGGAVLVVFAVLGFFLNDPSTSPYLWFDNAENWAHLVLGVVALLLSGSWAPADLQKWVTVVVGVVALYFAVAGFAVAGNPEPNWYGITNLEYPLDDLVHLVVGVWAIWAGLWPSSNA